MNWLFTKKKNDLNEEYITVLYLTDMSRETFKNLPDWYNDKVLDEPPD